MPEPASLFQSHACSASDGPKYAEYRDSGSPLLGEIPGHWGVKKLKFAARAQFSNVDKKSEEGEEPVRLCNYVDVYYHDRITADIEFMDATAEPREAAKFQLQPGDVLVTKDSEDPHDICVPAVVAEPLPGVLCGYHLAQIRPDPRRLHGSYLKYAFASSGIRDQFRMRANGITRFGLSQDDICSALFPLPPIPEQEAIAAWLDERTRRVDELVAAKRRLIDLLAEQRTALITHAVTKGLNPDAPTKPSGIDWLGDVPGHWEVKRLKFNSHLQTGLTLGKKHTDEEQSRLVLRPYLRVANVQDGWLDLDHITEVEVLPERIARYELRAGDVLMTEGGDFDKLGRGYVYEGQIDGCLHQNHIFAVRPDARKLDSRFLAAMLSCLHGRNYFTKTSQQTTNLASTNATKLGDFPVPLPPLAEQAQIMARVAEIASTLDSLTAAAEAAIVRLTEYRQALISAAVTGKINVCGAESTVQPEAASSCEPVIAGRINGETSGAGRTANKHFQRSVLAAEIIARIGSDRTFGRVKLQKALILAERHLQLAEIESQPMRAAAGPFDNAMMRSIQSQLQKSQWYEYRKNGDPLKFVPLAKAGGQKQYFDRYWGAKEAAFAALMDLLAKLDTQRSEIVATLYSAWNDFLIDQKPVTDDALVAEVLTNWDPAKTAIPEDKWRKAIGWMRGKGLVPTGYGAHTRIAQHDRSKE